MRRTVRQEGVLAQPRDVQHLVHEALARLIVGLRRRTRLIKTHHAVLAGVFHTQSTLSLAWLLKHHSQVAYISSEFRMSQNLCKLKSQTPRNHQGQGGKICTQ